MINNDIWQERVLNVINVPPPKTNRSPQESGPRTNSPRTGSRTGAECTGPSRRRGTPRWSATVTRATPPAPSVSRSSSRDPGASSGTEGGGRCSEDAPLSLILEWQVYEGIVPRKITSAWRLEVTKQKRLKKLVFWLFESGLRLDGIRSAWGGWCWWGGRMLYLR